jgi:hypothetical protein
VDGRFASAAAALTTTTGAAFVQGGEDGVRSNTWLDIAESNVFLSYGRDFMPL